jgi:hypothetical protein
MRRSRRRRWRRKGRRRKRRRRRRIAFLQAELIQRRELVHETNLLATSVEVS